MYLLNPKHFRALSAQEHIMPIDKPFAYHSPSPEGLARITAIREGYSTLKALVESKGTPSRQLSVALTELETSAMWAIKSVVFNDPDSVIAE